MKHLLYLTLAFSLVACTSKVEVEAKQADTPTTTIADMVVAPGSHTVQCGCSIDGIGTCGNYIEIDSKFVKISNSDAFGLDAMEWCGQGPTTAEASGAIKDGKFVATSFAVKE